MIRLSLPTAGPCDIERSAVTPGSGPLAEEGPGTWGLKVS